MTCTHSFVDADIVCSRAKNHYDPNEHLNFENTSTGDDPEAQIELFRKKFMPLHQNMRQLMYFS